MTGDSTPHLNITLIGEDVVEEAKTVLRTLRPTWDLDNIIVKVFTDGITNKLLGCFPEGQSKNALLIRIYGRNTDLLIDRTSETRTMQRLHAAGLASQLYATFQNGLVYEYQPGVVLTRDTCLHWETAELVAIKMADMHKTQSGTTPCLWRKFNQFHQLVPNSFQDQEKQTRLDGIEGAAKSSLEHEISFLNSKLTTASCPVVFCHNDLLLANVIANADDNSVAFIDFEYADLNYQAFDIANHFNEYAGVETVDYSRYPTEEYQRRWIKVYLERYQDGGPVPDSEVSQLYDEVQQFSLASHLFWALWAFIQAYHSTIDFDFLQYGALRLGQYFVRKKLVFGL